LEARPQGSTADLLATMRTVSEETHVDFAAIYGLEGETWKCRLTYPPDVPRIERTIGMSALETSEQAAAMAHAGGTGTSGSQPGQLQARRIAFKDPDLVAAGVVTRDSLVVVGFTLNAGFADKMRRTGDDLSRYQAVGLYVSVLRRYIIIVTCVLVVAMAVSATLVSRLLASRISHPITELAQATERIARGDLDHRIAVTAKDEIGSLVNDFNKMTEDLIENKRNLIRAERIAAWRDFARHFAHQIKNLLTPMEIATHRIRKRLEGGAAGADPARDKQVIEESLESIYKEIRALNEIARGFSEFAKLPEPQFESLDANEAVQSAIELQAAAPGKVALKTDLAPSLPKVQADREQLKSVVANLIKNALEAMPEGGTLTVRTSRTPGWVRIEVSDTGPGIPPDIKDKIFDPYFTTKAAGTGIGLPHAYRILEDHHAKITFTTGDAGTTFVVDLPVPEETKP
ncbi:MAG TPA: ATP-binding protein, partial [bacterium]|nr:ATP-binding protein [bacterium]